MIFVTVRNNFTYLASIVIEVLAPLIDFALESARLFGKINDEESSKVLLLIYKRTTYRDTV